MRIGRKILVGLGASLLCLVLSGQTVKAEVWSGPGGGADRNPIRGSVPNDRLGIAWTAGDDKVNLASTCVTYKDGVVFTSYIDQEENMFRLVALDAADGDLIWESDPVYYSTHCLVPVGDDLYTSHYKAGAGWTLVSLDASDGSINWENQLAEYTNLAMGNVLARDGRLFTTISYDYMGTLRVRERVALDLDTGDVLWHSGPTLGQDEITGVSSRYLFYLTNTGAIGAFNTASGSSDSSSLATNPISLPMVSSLFVTHASTGSSLVNRSPSDLSVRWARNMGAPNKVKALVADFDRVYVVYGTETTGRLTALQQFTGEPAWSDPVVVSGGPSELMLLGGRLYFVSTAGGSGVILDPSTGQETGRFSGFPSSQEFDFDQVAYGDGSFYGWRRFGSSFTGQIRKLVALRDVFPPDVEISGPVPGKYWSSTREVRWRAADRGGVGIDHFEIRVGAGPATNLPSTASSYTVSGLTPGENEIHLTAVDKLGNEASDSVSVEIDPAANPVVVFPLIQEAALITSSNLGFTDGGSYDTVLDGGIVRYEWDFDGDGTFETDAGANRTAETSVEDPGFRTIGLRVTNKAGNMAKVYKAVEFRLAPFGPNGGISINNGATFTNSPEVELDVSWPMLSTDVSVSNDGGFATSTSFPLPRNHLLNWTLAVSGSERLPKQVYVRYWGAGVDSVTYRDDIILDLTPPVIDQAVVSSGDLSASSSVASASSKARVRQYRIRLKARDGTSGVTAAQLSRGLRTRGPVVNLGQRSQVLDRQIKLRSKFRPDRIRVRDAAGNWSKPRRLK